MVVAREKAPPFRHTEMSFLWSEEFITGEIVARSSATAQSTTRPVSLHMIVSFSTHHHHIHHTYH
jgi:hypothetical protein